VTLAINKFSPNKIFSWHFSDFWSILQCLPDSCQIPWHFQVFHTSGQPHTIVTNSTCNSKFQCSLGIPQQWITIIVFWTYLTLSWMSLTTNSVRAQTQLKAPTPTMKSPTGLILQTNFHASPAVLENTRHLLWPPYVIGGPLYFCPVVSFLLSSSSFFFFPRLISAAAGWMSTIIWHMVWP